MNGPRKLIFAMIFTFVTAGFSSATDIYFAESSAGSNNGSSCANAYAYNDGTHGINISGNWVGGNTLHLCGTFSFGTNAASVVTAQASGSSGSPITIQFESGASLQASYWNTSTGAINVNGKNYITINGNSTGTIESMLDGSPGATCPGGACAYQQPNLFIYASGSSNLTIENFNGSGSLGPAYIHTQCEASSGCDGAVNVTDHLLYIGGGSNLLIHDNVMHDVVEPILDFYGNDDNVQVYNNDIYNFDSGIECAPPGTGVILAHLYIYNNHFHDMAIWDTGSADYYHHEAIHCYNTVGSYTTTKIQNLYIYNNVFDGLNCGTAAGQGYPTVQNCTAWIWLDPTSPWTDSTGTAHIWNNIIYGASFAGNGLLTVSEGNAHEIFNNTFLGPGSNVGPCINIESGATNVAFENNIIENCGIIVNPDSEPAATSISTWDYNLYANSSSGSTLWQYAGFSGNTLSAWQSSCSCDSHSQAQLGSAWADLNATTGVPSTGFAGLEQGANLTSLTTSALATLANSTTAGNSVSSPEARPTGTCSTQGSSSCWDIGAYEISNNSSTPAPAAPTGLQAVVQ